MDITPFDMYFEPEEVMTDSDCLEIFNEFDLSKFDDCSETATDHETQDSSTSICFNSIIVDPQQLMKKQYDPDCSTSNDLREIETHLIPGKVTDSNDTASLLPKDTDDIVTTLSIQFPTSLVSPEKSVVAEHHYTGTSVYFGDTGPMETAALSGIAIGSGPKKRKLWQESEFNDPVKEKKRLCAINSKRYREKFKKKVQDSEAIKNEYSTLKKCKSELEQKNEELEKEIKELKECNKHLMKLLYQTMQSLA